ncbi:MAG: hypothetical protein E7490_05645 [Ruminococcaceae bacterium]|nr:hypothetical protein [Oscillospiraceae bacterium]
MKKFFKKLSVALTMTLMLIITAIPVSAEAPGENGSLAKAAMLEEMQPVQSEESNALPGWLLFSGIGAVAVIGIIAGAVVLGEKQEDVSSDTEE